MFAKSVRYLSAAVFTTVLALAFSGCETQAPVPPGPPGPFSAIGAKDAKGFWSQSQVEKYLTQAMKLDSISLQSSGDNGYQGTAKGKDGNDYTLEVSQVAHEIETRWTSSTGTGNLSYKTH